MDSKELERIIKRVNENITKYDGPDFMVCSDPYLEGKGLTKEELASIEALKPGESIVINGLNYSRMKSDDYDKNI